MNRLENKVAVVTGASSGIGNAIARLYAAEGAKVVMFARREDKLRETETEIIAAGGEAIACPGDLCSGEDVTRLFDLTIEKYGKVDIVVNNAGLIRRNECIETVTDKDCYDLYEVNSLGPMRVCREAMKYMMPAKNGTFVFIGSLGGLMGHAGSAYAMTKGAMITLAKQIAVTYHRDGLRSNAICPNWVLTEFGFVDGKYVGQDERAVKGCMDHECSDTPPCTAEDVAKVALFLASEESKPINGQYIVCDNGISL